MQLWNLLIAFTKTNLIAFGGGPSIIPLIKDEVVNSRHWLSEAEFADALAVGNALPGPIATKLSTYIGYKIAGVPGAAVSLLGTVLPTAVLMLALSGLLFRYKDVPFVQGMIRGAKPVVWVLFLLLVFEYLPFVRPDKAGWVPAAIAAVGFCLAYFFKVNQALVIALGIAAGAVLLR